jgi:hypothetical protein
MADNDMLTITLTGRPPVRIAKADWPIIAEGRAFAHDGQVPKQANAKTTAWIRVRRHADGRAIVYGLWDHDTVWGDGRSVRAGRLLKADESMPEAIKAVGDELAACRGEDLLPPQAIDDIVRDCIADLPAEQLV